MSSVLTGASHESILTGHLREAIAALYPEVTVTHEAVFRPMEDISKGEVSSSAAIEIARATKKNAEEIADVLIQRVGDRVSATWRNDCGYMVCWGLTPEVLLSEIEPGVRQALRRFDFGTGTQPRFVSCLVPDSTEPVYARVRLVARALMQALLTVVYEGRVILQLHPAVPQELQSVDAAVQAFSGAVRDILAQESEVRVSVSLPESLERECAGRAVVWTTHHYHERLSTEVRSKLSRMRLQGSVQVIMPSDGWLLCRDRALSELLSSASLSGTVASIKSDEGWLRFLFHAASTIPSGDFDPAVALFEEFSSPLWNLRLLRERYERFAASYPLPVSKDTLAGACRTISERRGLAVTCMLLPSFVARAIARSEVGAFCAAFERIGRGGHGFINEPKTRLDLARGRLSPESGEIAASVGFALSSILPLLG